MREKGRQLVFFFPEVNKRFFRSRARQEYGSLDGFFAARPLQNFPSKESGTKRPRNSEPRAVQTVLPYSALSDFVRARWLRYRAGCDEVSINSYVKFTGRMREGESFSARFAGWMIAYFLTWRVLNDTNPPTVA